MKRLTAFLLVLTLLLSMTGCGQPAGQTEGPAVQEQTAQPQEHEQISWDVSEIFADEAAMESAFSDCEKQIDALAARKGSLNTVESVADFYAASDKTNFLAIKLQCYAKLQVDTNLADSAAKERQGRMMDLVMQYTEATAFALPEIFANSETLLNEVAAAPQMAPHLTHFNRDRAQQAHQLSAEEETLLLPVNELMNGAYLLYYAIVGSELTFPQIMFPDGTERTANEANYSLIRSPEYSQEFRLAYSSAMWGTYAKFRNTLAQNLQNYNTAVVSLADAHHYDSALEEDLSAMDVPISVYDGILEAAKQAGPSLAGYYALQKEKLGLDKLYITDLSIPTVKEPAAEFSYEEAQRLIKEALAPLGADYGAKIDEMFASRRIDVYPAANKQSGAYSLGAPGMPPYILMNYVDDYRSVSNLSHELGHSLYSTYAAEQASGYNGNPSAFTQEVTSTLNELLLSDYMIQNAKTEEERQYYAAQQIDLLYSAFFRQAQYALFQQSAVAEVEAGGTLTADKLDELWLASVRNIYGDTLNLPEDYANGWARIPHFYQGFYVYRYAVGINAACNIADRIQSGEPGAVEDYIAFLKAGDTGNAVELLQIAGVDVSNGAYVEAFITRFDRLVAQLK